MVYKSLEEGSFFCKFDVFFYKIKKYHEKLLLYWQKFAILIL